jgi:o-succinylbenzoate synthase
MRIESVRARSFAWPLDGRGAARGRRERSVIVVEVRDEDGAIGLGEAAPLPELAEDSLDRARAAIAQLAARVPFAIETAADAFALALQVAPTSASARFAIETALCDALARRAGSSLAAVLRPTPATRVEIAAVVDTADEARAAIAAGVRTLKLKLGPDEPLDRVRAIADAAPGARLRIDANRTWRLVGAAPPQLAQLAQRFGGVIAYVEEPCLATHRLLAHGPACKVALDESLATIPSGGLAFALTSPDLAALVLKPTLLGLAGALDLAARAHDHGVAAVVSHGLEGPIGTAACAELALAIADPAPAGLAAHGALTGWRLAVPQLAADHVHAIAPPGLAAVALDLAAVIAAALEPA